MTSHREKILHNLGHHLITTMEQDLRRKFAAWNQFATESLKAKPEKFPHMPVEMQVVSMKVADGEVFDKVGLDELPTDGGLPMKVVVSDPYFIEFKNAILPETGVPEYTEPSEIPTLIRAILSEHPKSVGFLHVAESWVWRGAEEDYVPYEEDPTAGPREEAMVMTFQMIDGSVLTGVMPIAEENGLRFLKPLEFALNPALTK